MKYFKEYIPGEWQNKYFLIFLTSMLIFATVWSIGSLPKLVKILTSLLFLLSYVIYNIKVITKEDSILIKFLNWTLFIIILLLTIAYIAATFKEITIATFTLLITFGTIVLSSLFMGINNLWKSRGIFSIISSYLVLAFVAIVLFGSIFTVIGEFEGNELMWGNESKVEDAWDYMYFSSSVFYSSTFGDIFPLGYSRLLVSLEFAFSFVIHIIILGLIISQVYSSSQE